MSGSALTFKRYEYKYLLTADKYARFFEQLSGYIQPDRFFASTVCSIYYDTPNYALIRNSIRKPVFKEKLRVRSYNTPEPDGEVFVELKRKFDGLVYKRRAVMTAAEAEAYLSGRAPAPYENQIIREIDWFLKSYEIVPAVLISCERRAYVACENHDLRITFDHDLRWRNTELDLCAGAHGEPILADGMVLMELKIPGSAPLWLARLLSENEIFPGGFSKYGTCYKNNLVNSSLIGVLENV